jgi:hypothetical protein
MTFLSYEELLDAIGEVVTGIESETLTAVFEHWMERLEWVSKNDGDYYPETASWIIYFSPMFIRNQVAEPEWDTRYLGRLFPLFDKTYLDERRATFVFFVNIPEGRSPRVSGSDGYTEGSTDRRSR